MTSILEVSHLSKKFCRSLRQSLWYGVGDIARELIPGRQRNGNLRTGEFWALEDLSFRLERGEALAVIGDNGAGKSTLLKVVSGLLKPDRGEVRTAGRIEPIIELGSSFKPVLSGRENIRVAAALHGLSARRTGDLIEQIIEFTELGDLIDAPLQSYSTGMRARLAYALPAHLDPDVLLVDEALVVGDAMFQRKCIAHMNAYRNRGGALLLVSHNTWQIQSLCTRGILLDRGRIVFRGTAGETLNELFDQRRQPVRNLPLHPSRASSPVEILDVLAESLDGRDIRNEDPLRISVSYRCTEAADITWSFVIWTADRWIVITGSNDANTRRLEAGIGELTCVIPRLPLVGGRYALGVAITDQETRSELASRGWHDAPVVLDVQSSPDPFSVAQMQIHQLTTVEVEWE